MIFHSPYPDVEIPTDITLPDYLMTKARQWPEKTAYIDGETDEVRTFGDVIDLSERVAAGLAELSMRQGDVIAIFSPNTWNWPIAYYGALLAGGIVTTVNHLYTAEELRRQIEDTNATYIFTVPELLDRVQEAATTTSIKEVIVFGSAPGAVSFDVLLDTDAEPPVSTPDPADVCLLPSSSGTTGRPKAVMLTHQAIVANITQSLGTDIWEPDNTLLNALPFYHLAGLGGFLHIGFAAGCSTVLLPSFDLEKVLQCIERYRVTLTIWVPPILLTMTKYPVVDDYDLSSLKQVISGSAPVGRELGDMFSSRLDTDLLEVYGMTELSPVSHLTPPDGIVLGSTGPLIPNTEGKIVDLDTGTELGPNQQGEIWVRGPQVMKGYLNRPDATAITITPDGWLRTGDIGFADENGYFYIVDRVKELIKYKAYQVAPAELEDVLKGHPAIADAAVIGSPDEEAGELPKAIVVKAGDISEEEIISYVAERVAPFKKIRLVEFTDEIPKTASGKILRRDLIERERQLVAI